MLDYIADIYHNEYSKTGKGLTNLKESRMDNMTDKQMQFIAWLITTATDKCQSMEEVKEMNAEIRRHSAGLKPEETEKPE